VAAWYAADVAGLPVYVILWLFLIYSCAGVLVEGIFCFVLHRRLELRLGLLYLPLRPIYGLGGAACTVLLTPLLDHPVVVFALSVVICSAVEFVAGWAVERLFRTISWDYSDKRLNLRGRVCLQYSLCWGVLATAALYALQPLVAEVVQQPVPRQGETLLTVLLVLTLLSAVLTLAALHRARRRIDAVGARSPGEPTTSSNTSWDRLVARLVPDRVLIVSLPRMGLSAELRELNQDRWTTGTRSSTSAAHVSRNPGEVRGVRREAVRADLERPVRR
jgi:uncharacterized membrane protein